MTVNPQIRQAWLQHSTGVPESMIKQASVISGKEGEATLKLRRRFMRTGYVPREDADPVDTATVRESNSDRNDAPAAPSADVLNDTRIHTSDSMHTVFDTSTDSDESDDGTNSSNSSDISCENGSLPDAHWDDEEFPDEATTEFPLSLAHSLFEMSQTDSLQYAALQTLERLRRSQEGDSDTSDEEEGGKKPPSWQQYSNAAEKAAVERGEQLVMTYGDDPIDDIDPRWFYLVLPDHFPNGQGAPPPGMSVRRWWRILIERHKSKFQEAVFVCAVGDQGLRHGVNLAAHLQFKASPDQFHTANQATADHIKRSAEILAKRGRPRQSDPPPVHALCKQVTAVAARVPGSHYSAKHFRAVVFAGLTHFGGIAIFFTINPLETRSPFCWSLAGADDPLRYYPITADSPVQVRVTPKHCK